MRDEIYTHTSNTKSTRLKHAIDKNTNPFMKETVAEYILFSLTEAVTLDRTSTDDRLANIDPENSNKHI